MFSLISFEFVEQGFCFSHFVQLLRNFSEKVLWPPFWISLSEHALSIPWRQTSTILKKKNNNNKPTNHFLHATLTRPRVYPSKCLGKHFMISPSSG